MTLRDYQREAIAAILADWAEVDRTLAVLATGTGKTIIFLALLEQLRQAGQLGRALIVAHRRELIQQPLERARAFFPELAAGMGVVMASDDDVAARHVVATVQTLASDRRLTRLLEHGAFSHLVVDECHHATAGTYQRLVERVGAAKVLGVTATPLRTDGDGLVRVFQRVSYRLPISAAIRRGALVPFNALGVSLPVSLAGIRETEDGWAAEPMGNLLAAENVLEIVHDHWRQYAADRRTIIFTASVAQARATAEFFAAKGAGSAAWVSGETPKRERDRILADFQAGRLQVVANCMVLTEGFDAPETSAVLMVAPTKSDLIYVQRLGRGLRTAEGKSDCLVLDFAPLEDRNVVMAGDVLGKPREVKQAEARAERQGVLVALQVDRLGEAATIDPGQLIVRVLNLLRQDALSWTVDGLYATAALSEADTLCLALPDPARLARAEALRRGGDWNDRYQRRYQFLAACRLYRVNGRARLVGHYPSIDEAKGAADDLALDLHAGEHVLAKKQASWRREPATPAQRRMLQKLGVTIPEDAKKGAAAQLITHHLAVSRVKEVEK